MKNKNCPSCGKFLGDDGICVCGVKLCAAFSDMHLDPGDLFMADLRGYHNVYVVGDLFNLIPWGLDIWKESPGRLTVETFVDGLPDNGCDYIIGNHEGREAWIRELFKAYPKVRVHSELEIESNGRTYRFKHGHQYTYWRILSIGADDVVQYLTGWNRTLRNWWYNFCINRGWMPSKITNRSRGLISRIFNRNPKNYNELVAWIWSFALREAHTKENMTLVIGHTHQAIKLGPSEFNCEVIDLGAGQIHELEM